MNRILVVEDEKPILNLIRMNLLDAGYGCVCAENGLEAADILEQETFDLAILDIMLPGLNGYELLEYMRPMQIPVIFLTAKSDVADRVRGLKLGAEDYMVKPFEIEERYHADNCGASGPCRDGAPALPQDIPDSVGL